MTFDLLRSRSFSSAHSLGRAPFYDAQQHINCSILHISRDLLRLLCTIPSISRLEVRSGIRRRDKRRATGLSFLVSLFSVLSVGYSPRGSYPFSRLSRNSLSVALAVARLHETERSICPHGHRSEHREEACHNYSRTRRKEEFSERKVWITHKVNSQPTPILFITQTRARTTERLFIAVFVQSLS